MSNELNIKKTTTRKTVRFNNNNKNNGENFEGVRKKKHGQENYKIFKWIMMTNLTQI